LVCRIAGMIDAAVGTLHPDTDVAPLGSRELRICLALTAISAVVFVACVPTCACLCRLRLVSSRSTTSYRSLMISRPPSYCLASSTSRARAALLLLVSGYLCVADQRRSAFDASWCVYGCRPRSGSKSVSECAGADFMSPRPGVARRSEAGYCVGCSRHSRGEAPNRCLKMRLKWARSLKPQAKAISLTCRAICAGSARSRLHRSRRCIWT
jgi:hypothetical protein